MYDNDDTICPTLTLPRLNPSLPTPPTSSSEPKPLQNSPAIRLLHPQTQLPTRRPRRDPIVCRMELRNGRDGGDAFAAELGQLFALGRVDVDEAVHVADAEPLHVVRGTELPLGAEA